MIVLQEDCEKTLEVELRDADSLAEDLADDVLNQGGDVGRELVAQRLEDHREVRISVHLMGWGICQVALAVAVLPCQRVQVLICGRT